MIQFVFFSDAGVNESFGMGAIYFKTSLDNNCYAKIKAKTDDESGTSGRIEFSTDVDAITNATSPKMVLDSLGNLGIGTTSPAEKLTVIGDILIDNNMNSTLYLGKGAEGVDGVTKIKCTQTGTDTDELGLSFFVHGSSSGTTPPYEAMSITHTGNVGIGTTNPQFKFEIQMSQNWCMVIVLIITTNRSSGIQWLKETMMLNQLPTDENSFGIFSAYNGDLFLSASDGNINSNPMDYSRLFIEASTGAVGIGTTSPNAKLEVWRIKTKQSRH